MVHQVYDDAVPPPVPLTQRGTLPPFPVDALPAAVAAMVTAVSDFTQTDLGMAGTSALSMLAACAGGRVEVQVRPGWNEPVNIYTVTVAAPGERKSAVQAMMGRPLLDAEAELADAGKAARMEAETTQNVAAKAAEQAKAAAGRAEGTERDRLLADAISLAAAADSIVVPPMPRLAADDVTPEAAASLLAEQGGRLAVISAEGGIFDTMAGRYSGNVANLDVWLKGHAGDPLRVDRKGRPPEYVRRPALTLGLMIQPAVLEAIARHDSFRGRGLLARFLYAVPPSRVGRRRVGMPSVPDLVAKEWHRLVHDLALTLADWHDPAILSLDVDAQALVLDIERHIEPQLGPSGELGHIADWGAKLTGRHAANRRPATPCRPAQGRLAATGRGRHPSIRGSGGGLLPGPRTPGVRCDARRPRRRRRGVPARRRETHRPRDRLHPGPVHRGQSVPIPQGGGPRARTVDARGPRLSESRATTETRGVPRPQALPPLACSPSSGIRRNHRNRRKVSTAHFCDQTVSAAPHPGQQGRARVPDLSERPVGRKRITA